MTALDRNAIDWQPAPFAPAGSLRVIRAATPAEVEAVLDLRRRVFGTEQGIATASVNDPDDDRSVHALALRAVAAGLDRIGHRTGLRTGSAGWHPVGTGRLTLRFGERDDALIAWVATIPEARQQGVGTAVMRFLLAAADDAGAPLVALAAQTHAERFYRRLGFMAAGSPYLVRGIEHRWMARYRPG